MFANCTYTNFPRNFHVQIIKTNQPFPKTNIISIFESFLKAPTQFIDMEHILFLPFYPSIFSCSFLKIFLTFLNKSKRLYLSKKKMLIFFWKNKRNVKIRNYRVWGKIKETKNNKFNVISIHVFLQKIWINQKYLSFNYKFLLNYLVGSYSRQNGHTF